MQLGTHVRTVDRLHLAYIYQEFFAQKICETLINRKALNLQTQFVQYWQYMDQIREKRNFLCAPLAVLSSQGPAIWFPYDRSFKFMIHVHQLHSFRLLEIVCGHPTTSGMMQRLHSLYSYFRNLKQKLPDYQDTVWLDISMVTSFLHRRLQSLSRDWLTY